MANQKLTDKTELAEQAGSGDLLMVVDVSDTTGSTAGTSKKHDFKYVIQTDKISLSNAEAQALNTTSKTLVGALSGYMITVYNVNILNTYASATETSNNNLILGYDSSSTTQYWHSYRRYMASITTDASYSFGAVLGSAPTCTTTLLNKPFLMWSNAAFNGGWSADVYVTYAYTKIL